MHKLCKWGDNLHTIMIFRNGMFNVITFQNLVGKLKIFIFTSILTPWGRVTHICFSKLTIIDSDDGLSPERRQANIWNNAGILLIGTLRTSFSEILSKIHTFSFKKMHLKTSSAKRRPFCLGLNVLSFRDSTIENTWGLRRISLLHQQLSMVPFHSSTTHFLKTAHNRHHIPPSTYILSSDLSCHPVPTIVTPLLWVSLNQIPFVNSLESHLFNMKHNSTHKPRGPQIIINVSDCVNKTGYISCGWHVCAFLLFLFHQSPGQKSQIVIIFLTK